MPHEMKRTIRPRLDETQVRLQLVRRGWGQRDLAEAVGRSLPVVNQAIKHGENQRTVELIAEELGLELISEEAAA